MRSLERKHALLNVNEVWKNELLEVPTLSGELIGVWRMDISEVLEGLMQI